MLGCKRPQDSSPPRARLARDAENRAVRAFSRACAVQNNGWVGRVGQISDGWGSPVGRRARSAVYLAFPSIKGARRNSRLNDASFAIQPLNNRSKLDLISSRNSWLVEKAGGPAPRSPRHGLVSVRRDPGAAAIAADWRASSVADNWCAGSAAGAAGDGVTEPRHPS